jgi:hypothetical protein
MARLRGCSIIVTLTLVATAGSFAAAAAAPLHQHHPAHADRRAIVTQYEQAPPEIVYELELNGETVDQTEVCNGIKAGTLKWAEGTENPPDCAASAESASPSMTSAKVIPTSTSTQAEVASTNPTSTALPTTSIQAELSDTTPSASVQQVTLAQVITSGTASAVSIENLNGFVKEEVKANPVSTSQTSAPIPSSSAAAPAQSQASSSVSSSTSGGQGLDTEFPDGEIDCAIFPSNYGPINVEWAKLGGWSGIQYVTIQGNDITHIDTAVPGADGCKPGAMCSYACPPGYQKSQWPSAQGSTGQSVGGLSCNSNGKLALTNPDLSKTLCIHGTGAVTVQNKLSYNAAICRTDYPGLFSTLLMLGRVTDFHRYRKRGCASEHGACKYQPSDMS